MQDLLRFSLLKLPWEMLAKVDLSAENCARLGFRPWLQSELSLLLEQEMERLEAPVLWGGYLEVRAHYSHAALFEGEEPREIHMGIDFWANAGTAVYAPWGGVLHSQRDNPGERDYGPTIILEHQMHGQSVHSLYGHLSMASLKLHKPGDHVAAGELLGWMGVPAENGGWPPHLHFQLIHDLEGWQGDYPGVAAKSRLDHFKRNCPDPSVALGLFSE